MLVAHLHFGGCCEEAIWFYQKVFGTKADFIDRDDAGGIAHAEMHIHGQRVMMNDNYGGNGKDAGDFSIQMVLIFKTEEQFLQCYEILKEESLSFDLPRKTFFSPLTAGITDKFNIRWGLMVDGSID